MSVFRTSSLFRFCKERKMLQNYLKTGIYPNYCEEDLSCEKSELKIGIPMDRFVIFRLLYCLNTMNVTANMVWDLLKSGL